MASVEIYNFEGLLSKYIKFYVFILFFRISREVILHGKLCKISLTIGAFSIGNGEKL